MSYSAQELEHFAARNLSSFGGGDYPSAFDGYPSAYTGEDDPLLSFGGAGMSFVNRPTTKYFRFRITNASGSPGKVYLCPGLDLTATGTIADGTFTDVTGTVTMEGTASSKSILKFRSLVALEPTEIIGMKITSGSDSQVTEPIYMFFDTPWDQDPESKTFHATNGQDQYTYQTGVNVFETPGLVFSRTTRVEYTVAADVTIEIWAGGQVDFTKYLQRARAAAAVPARPFMGNVLGGPGKGLINGR